MKRKFLLSFMLVILFACFMAFSVSANEQRTYYLVSDVTDEAVLNVQAQFEEAASDDVIDVDTLFVSTGSDFINKSEYTSLKFILCEDLTTKKVANDYISIGTAKDVTFILNGYKWTFGDGRISAFLIHHHDAKFSLYGNYAKDENGVIDKDFSECDITSDNVPVWYWNGTVYVENVRSSSGEEFFFIEAKSNKAGRTVEFKDCALDTKSCEAIGAKNSTDVSDHVYKIDGGVYDGIKVHTPIPGSCIMNCEIYGQDFHMDCWRVTNYSISLKNVTVEKNIKTASGRAYIELFDCTYGGLNLGSDGGGNSKVYEYKSATCEANGSKINHEKGTASVIDEAYVDLAKGHTFCGDILRVEYENLASNGTYYGKCANCEGEASKEAMPVFKPLGYSYFLGGSVMQGFALNKDALEKYETANEKVSFGVLLAVKNNVSSDKLLDVNGGKINENDKLITSDFSEKGFDIFEIKLSGLTSKEEYKTLDIYICGYYIANGNVYYMNLTTVSDSLSGMDATFDKITQE